MSTPKKKSSPSSGNTPEAQANFGVVALAIGIMAAVLGVGALLLPSLAVLLTVLVVIEAIGTFVFAKRAEGDSVNELGGSVNEKPASRARVARGLALLGVAMSAVALVLAGLG